MENDGISFEQYLEICKVILMKAAVIDEQTAKIHINGGKKYYKDCYDADDTPDYAVSEDISSWEQ